MQDDAQNRCYDCQEVSRFGRKGKTGSGFSEHWYCDACWDQWESENRPPEEAPQVIVRCCQQCFEERTSGQDFPSTQFPEQNQWFCDSCIASWSKEQGSKAPGAVDGIADDPNAKERTCDECGNMSKRGKNGLPDSPFVDQWYCLDCWSLFMCVVLRKCKRPGCNYAKSTKVPGLDYCCKLCECSWYQNSRTFRHDNSCGRVRHEESVDDGSTVEPVPCEDVWNGERRRKVRDREQDRQRLRAREREWDRELDRDKEHDQDQNQDPAWENDQDKKFDSSNTQIVVAPRSFEEVSEEVLEAREHAKRLQDHEKEVKRWQEILTSPLKYEVIPEPQRLNGEVLTSDAITRQEPNDQAKEVAKLRCGCVIHGYPGVHYLQILAPGDANLNGSWVQLDRVELVHLRVIVSERMSDCALLEWRGVKEVLAESAKTEEEPLYPRYYARWRPARTGPLGLRRQANRFSDEDKLRISDTSDTTIMLGGFPEGATVEFCVEAILNAAGRRLAGNWLVSATTCVSPQEKAARQLERRLVVVRKVLCDVAMSYEVLQCAPVLEMPDPNAEEIKNLMPGPRNSVRTIKGFPAGEYLCLSRMSENNRSVEGKWVFVEGYLAPAALQITVKERLSDFIEASWPGYVVGSSGFCSVQYVVEWVVISEGGEPGDARQQDPITECQIFLGPVPTGYSIDMRIVGRVGNGSEQVEVHGRWITSTMNGVSSPQERKAELAERAAENDRKRQAELAERAAEKDRKRREELRKRREEDLRQKEEEEEAERRREAEAEEQQRGALAQAQEERRRRLGAEEERKRKEEELEEQQRKEKEKALKAAEDRALQLKEQQRLRQREERETKEREAKREKERQAEKNIMYHFIGDDDVEIETAEDVPDYGTGALDLPAQPQDPKEAFGTEADWFGDHGMVASPADSDSDAHRKVERKLTPSTSVTVRTGPEATHLASEILSDAAQLKFCKRCVPPKQCSGCRRIAAVR